MLPSVLITQPHTIVTITVYFKRLSLNPVCGSGSAGTQLFIGLLMATRLTFLQGITDGCEQLKLHETSNGERPVAG